MMTSLEIAELTGKNHKDVMRDIRSLIEQGAIDQRSFALIYYMSEQGNKSTLGWGGKTPPHPNTEIEGLAGKKRSVPISSGGIVPA